MSHLPSGRRQSGASSVEQHGARQGPNSRPREQSRGAEFGHFVSFLLPEGDSRIAQQFTAGFELAIAYVPQGRPTPPMSYVSSYCLFTTKDRPRMAQPSLRDFGYLPRNPTLERVGYSQISLREIGVGYSRISSPGDVSRKPHRLQQHTAGKCPKLQAPLRSESSSPDTEMVPLKTAGNHNFRSI